MKRHTSTTIVLLGVGMAWALGSGPAGCSCSGDELTLGVDGGDGAPEAAPAPQEPAPAPAPDEAARLAAMAQAVAAAAEEADEQPLPVDEADEAEVAANEEPAPAPQEPVEETGQELPLAAVAYQFVTDIVEEPRPGSRVIGYLRRGAKVRVTERVRGRGCERGWHGVEGGGYVCHADGVVVGEDPPPWPDAPVAARLDSPLPYDYYGTVRDFVPEYFALPTRQQEAQVASLVRSLPATDAGAEVEEVPPDAGAPSSIQLPEAVRALLARGFIVSVTEGQGRWVRTVRGRYVERTVLTEREGPEFAGVELGQDLTLPIAFVVVGRAKALRPRPGEDLRFDEAGTLRRLSVLPVLGEVRREDRRYVSIGNRLLARDDVLAIAEPVERPPQVGPDERWIDICLSTQTLVAYEGDQPVFATVVSTGRSADGFATPTGSFSILTKHVSTTMDNTTMGAEAYSIEDVPWTMYFHESYALHGAFWHNNFGRERSHGCVNLSPADARWLFFWTLPELPPGWHGVRAGEGGGTVVVIRP
jgi:hypothetical protein